MELTNGEISFPPDDAAGADNAAAAGPATPPASAPRPGSGASSATATTPRKPRRSVMFRRITGRRLPSSPPAAPAAADDDYDEMTGIAPSAGGGLPHPHVTDEDDAAARTKWLRVIDVKLEDRSDDSNSEDNDGAVDGGTASPNPTGGERGAGRLNRRARSHSAGDADDGGGGAGGGRPRKKRRRLAMVVEGSATVLESDFYASSGGGGAGATADGAKEGVKLEDGADDGGEYYYETYRLDDPSLLRLVPSAGSSDVPDLERASGLGDDDDSRSSGSDGALLVSELRGGSGAFGYWSEGGELVLESGQGVPGVGASGPRGGTRLFHPGADAEGDEGGGEEEEHDSNDEGYGGNDYPDDDEEDENEEWSNHDNNGEGRSYECYEDYRDADDYADFSDSDDDEGRGGGGPGGWRASFRSRFVDRSSLNY